jgi:hypothetical protein
MNGDLLFFTLGMSGLKTYPDKQDSRKETISKAIAKPITAGNRFSLYINTFSG